MKRKYLVILAFIFLLVAIFVIKQLDITRFFIEEYSTHSMTSHFDRLRTLPYVDWSPVKKEDEVKKGVVKYSPHLSYNGFNLYNSPFTNKAYLIDMHGEVLHTWTSETGDWHTVELNENGDLFFIVRDEMLGKLDRNSNIRWKSELRYHHWITIAENGDIYSLTRDKSIIRHGTQSIPILNDFITILSPKGKVKKKISVYKLLGKKIPKGRLNKISKIINNKKIYFKLRNETPFDVFHTDSVKIINRDINGLCKKGDVLISVREINLIAIVDLKEERVVWSWGEDDLYGQHDATLLENGNMLVFDNGKDRRDYSRIIELNPITKKIEWEYRGNPPNSFYSVYMGSCQKLPNGNVLITESSRGRVFEITSNKEIVWEFYNPAIKQDKRATIYRMKRLQPDSIKEIASRVNEKDKKTRKNVYTEKYEDL